MLCQVNAPNLKQMFLFFAERKRKSVSDPRPLR
jgi:hypothetical protein